MVAMANLVMGQKRELKSSYHGSRGQPIGADGAEGANKRETWRRTNRVAVPTDFLWYSVRESSFDGFRGNLPVRQIGTLPKSLDPKVFADYLLGLGIKTRVDSQPEGWQLWIYNEDHFTRARDEFQSYVSAPDSPRYRDAQQAAEAVRRKQEQIEREFRKNDRRVADLWAYPGFRRRPLTMALVAVCVVIFLLQESQWGPCVRERLHLRILLPGRRGTDRRRSFRPSPWRDLAAGDTGIHARKHFAHFL